MAQTTHAPQYPLERSDWLLAGGVFIAALVLYVRTLATQLLLGDSGEFQTLAATLGLAHPTGYPVYILISRLVTLLVPLGDIAYRANLLSAICGALTLALVYLLGRTLGGWRIAALVGAASLGVCKLFWWHAVIAEVYDPAAALLALVLLLGMLWRRTGRSGLLFWAGLAGGLSLGVHYAVLLAAPAVLLYLALATPKAAWKTAWLRATLGALVGVVLCLAIFFSLDALNAPSSYINAIMRPNLSVLDITPQQFASPSGRITYLAVGKQFQGQLFSLPKARVIQNLRVYIRTLPEQFPKVVLALAALGLAALFLYRRKGEPSRWREGLLFLIAWAAQVGYIIDYDIGDYFVFYIPGYVLLALAASVGAAALLDLLAWLGGRIPRLAGRPAAWIGGLAGLALAAAAVWPMLGTLQKSWRQERITFLDGTNYQDYPYPVRDAGWPHSLAKSVTSQVEDNAIIFTDWSVVYPIYYVAHVEEGRTGIAVHEMYPAMTPKPFADSAIQYIRQNYPRRPIYFMAIDGRLAQSYRFLMVSADPELYRLEQR